MSAYFTKPDPLARFVLARAIDINSRMDAVEAGFDNVFVAIEGLGTSIFAAVAEAMGYAEAASDSADAAAASAASVGSSVSTATSAASTATTQAGIATTQAGIATSAAGAATAAQAAAETAETNAETAETNAETAAALAAEWAEKVEDSAVTGYPGQYSALHHAAKAAASASSASGSASTATTQAGIATTKAGEASASADAAAASASAVGDEVLYAAEWANKAEDSLVSVAAGGDNVDDYSSKHWAAKAAASAAAAATFNPANYLPIAGGTLTGNLIGTKLALGYANPLYFNTTPAGYTLYDERAGACYWMSWDNTDITAPGAYAETSFETWVGANYEYGGQFYLYYDESTGEHEFLISAKATTIAFGSPVGFDFKNWAGSAHRYSLRIAPPGAASVNYLKVEPADTTAAPALSAQGSDTNINLNLTAKGTGVIAPQSPVTMAAGKKVTFAPTGTAAASLNIAYGTKPTTPAQGDVWSEQYSGLWHQRGSVMENILTANDWVSAASASTVDLGAIDATCIEISGTTTITSFGSAPLGTIKILRFLGAVALPYNPTGHLMSGGGLTTQANDIICVGYLDSISGWHLLFSSRTGGGTVASTYKALRFSSDEYDAGNSGTSKEISWANGGSQKLTLTGNLATFTFSNPIPGIMKLKIVQGAGPYTITWPSINWKGGAAPTLSTGSGDVDFVVLYYDGSAYWGEHAADWAAP